MKKEKLLSEETIKKGIKTRNFKWSAIVAIVAIFGSTSIFGQDTLTYNGMMEPYTIPEGVNSIQIEVWGAEAEAVTVDDHGGSIGGRGGYAQGFLDVTAGDVLHVYVGGKGENGVGGWNGGGSGGAATSGFGGSDGFAGSGGGASDVRFGGTDLEDRILVAGGGGGGGRNYVHETCTPCGTGGNGGVGGGISGGNGADPGDDIYDLWYDDGAGGTGGTAVMGGNAGAGAGEAGIDGVLGIGGAGAAGEYGTAGGGGGGGYFGGGSGAAPSSGYGAGGGGGAGGSSYTGGVDFGSTLAGIREGHGMVVITYVCDAEIAMTSTVAGDVDGADGEIDLHVTGGNGSYTFDWDTDGTGDFDDPEDLTDLIPDTYNVSIASGPACDTLTETINLLKLLSLNEGNALEFEINVYPNPTTGNATIIKDGLFEYQILTMHGQLVLNGKGLNTAEVNLQELENGVYFIKVKTANQSDTIRLIKQ